ncbi:hypothetical protein IMX26_02770 [Clostridium sp. 'deep sea']|uniref:hypothetical protein n=1 Tax=Clostridium sp. 'deep sea' TaxID=2779445 RepID=UPI00189653E7|nr:hypothetical protein [Clostridium sp. 'deep sea']QOR35763.1 hypothetical protein IMX26_02770 [Clostridium sp. 'deep sea']
MISKKTLVYTSLFIVCALVIFFALPFNKTKPVIKPYIIENKNINTSYSYENANYNLKEYTIQNLSDSYEVKVIFELYEDGHLKKVLEKSKKCIYENSNLDVDIGLHVITQQKDNGKINMIFALKNDTYVGYTSMEDLNFNINEYSIETKTNFSPKVDEEYTILSYLVNLKENCKEPEKIENYKYAYFLKLNYTKINSTN